MRLKWLTSAARLGLGVLLAGAWIVPASADTTVTKSVSGSVSSVCSITQGSVTLSASKGAGNNAPVVQTFSPNTVSITCNKANGTLSVSSTRLSKTAGPGGADSTVNYILTAAGWKNNGIDQNITYDTTNLPAASQGTNARVGTFPVTFSTNLTTLANNSAYSATITLGISANP